MGQGRGSRGACPGPPRTPLTQTEAGNREPWEPLSSLAAEAGPDSAPVQELGYGRRSWTRQARGAQGSPCSGITEAPRITGHPRGSAGAEGPGARAGPPVSPRGLALPTPPSPHSRAWHSHRGDAPREVPDRGMAAMRDRWPERGLTVAAAAGPDRKGLRVRGTAASAVRKAPGDEGGHGAA